MVNCKQKKKIQMKQNNFLSVNGIQKSDSILILFTFIRNIYELSNTGEILKYGLACLLNWAFFYMNWNQVAMSGAKHCTSSIGQFILELKMDKST